MSTTGTLKLMKQLHSTDALWSLMCFLKADASLRELHLPLKIKW